MRKVAAMAHDPRFIEIVTATADELEEDIRKLAGDEMARVTIERQPPARR